MRLQSNLVRVLLMGMAIQCGVADAAALTIFEKPLSPRIANYEIDVRLEPATRTLVGAQVVSWRNDSDDIIEELRFHLYLNAFRNNRSTVFNEAGATLRGEGIDEDGWGLSEIERVALRSGEDLTDCIEFIQPDNKDEFDKTVFRLPLPEPVLPGEKIELEMDFRAVLPTPPIRTGAKEEYFFVGQWFPKVGVYIDGEWNCHQFHANSEFFADFGVYDVRITVPKENVVGATGLEVEVTSNDDGTATHYYRAEDVHDFAWSTSPEFVEFKDRVRNIDVRVLMQPDHIAQGPRHVQAAKDVIAYFEEWIGDYPFPNLTVVDPRRGAMNSGGMEYPTLITAGTVYNMSPGIRLPELVIIHEFAHNYWYHLVATNEFEESWLDEGFTQYSEVKIMNDLYGPYADLFDFMWFEIKDRQFSRGRFIADADIDPMSRFSWEYYSRSSYRCNSYTKPAMMMLTLEYYLGEEVMREVLRTYFERWRFRHPKSRDFIDVASEVSGEDLAWFFDQVLRSNAVLDYSVSHVFTEEVEKKAGYDFTLESRSGEDIKKSDGEDEKLYRSEVYIRRLGGFVFPVEIEVKFEGGETIHETWDGRDTWKKFVYIKTKKLESATVDPDRGILLDVNFTNNSRAVEPEDIGVAGLFLKTLFGAQFLLDHPDIVNFSALLGNLR